MGSEAMTEINTGAVGGAGPYDAKQAKRLGMGHILCGCIVLVFDLVRLLSGDEPTFGIFASVSWLLSGGFAIGGAASKTRCMVLATMVLSIISAITAGILTLAANVEIFGVDRHRDNCCNMEQRINTKDPHLDNGMGDCCYDNKDNPVGPDTVIHLLVGIAMLTCSIYSASLTCLAKDVLSQRTQGVVWGHQPGVSVQHFAPSGPLNSFPHQPTGGQWLLPTYNDALNNIKK